MIKFLFKVVVFVLLLEIFHFLLGVLTLQADIYDIIWLEKSLKWYHINVFSVYKELFSLIPYKINQLIEVTSEFVTSKQQAIK